MATYVFCGLSGPVDLLTARSSMPAGVTPRDADYAALVLSFIGEGLVFHAHTHGRAPLDVLIHELLVYVIAAQAACLCVEMAQRSSVVAALSRGYCAVLQGTWLIQIAFVLFDPRKNKRWDPRSERDCMLAATVFAAHMVAALVYVSLLGAIFARRGAVAYYRVPQEPRDEMNGCSDASATRGTIISTFVHSQAHASKK
ncbi:hypothetical protein V5799_013658 [Amblyomma americanum]|uniref:Uncharacterized protein n=1 Tax=Amblyomma americanum TaxID=6943 RepID=A0AAQ4E5A6_AMBAM